MPIGYLVPTPLEPHSPIHILLLTGVPGIGKTTIIKNVAERFKGKRLSGFYTEEIREHGERRGFRLVIFEGQERVIAHVDFPRAHCVGKYGVDVAVLDELVGPALVLNNAVAVYLVDEIGKMECSDPFGGSARFRPLTVPSVSLAFFEVPTGGFTAFGHMYVFQWTDHRDLGGGKFTDPIGHTALTRSDDDGRTFRLIYEDLGERFVYMTPAVVCRGTVAGLPPSSSGDGLLIWGAGAYRDSDPYLAYVPLVSEQILETKSSFFYFSGIDTLSGQPTWSQQESEAEPVFRSADPCIGELSVTWEPNLG